MAAEPPRVIFGNSFDSLFSRELRAHITPTLDAEFKKHGVNLSKPFQPAYAVEVWAEVIELLSKHLYPKDSREAAQWKLGRNTIDGFVHTLIGKAAFGFMRLVGPVRSVERAARTYANANNYTRVELKRIGPTSFEFTLNEKHTLPEYDMGVLEAVLEHVGARQPHVTLIKRDAEGFTLKLEWAA
jgi:uncharacterized protein (TIGR02265 family)